MNRIFAVYKGISWDFKCSTHMHSNMILKQENTAILKINHSRTFCTTSKQLWLTQFVQCGAKIIIFNWLQMCEETVQLWKYCNIWIFAAKRAKIMNCLLNLSKQWVITFVSSTKATSRAMAWGQKKMTTEKHFKHFLLIKNWIVSTK